MKIRNLLLACCLLTPWFHDLQAGEGNQKPTLKRTPPIETLDDLPEPSSFHIGLSKRTIQTVEKKSDEWLKEVKRLHKSIDDLPQKLREVSQTTAAKMTEGFGVVIGLITLCFSVVRYSFVDQEKRSLSDLLPGVIAGSVIASVFGLLLSR
jgi:hypothetical protein